MGHDLRDFFFCNTVLLCLRQVIAEALIGKPLSHQRDDGHEGAVAEAELSLSAPDLSEEHVIVQFREFRGEFAQGISACRLLDCHVSFLPAALRTLHGIPVRTTRSRNSRREPPRRYG